MEDNPLFWQSFYGNASERHANLYYEQASRSFDLEKKVWINRSEVDGEGENLQIAAEYFRALFHEEIHPTDTNDSEKLSLAKSLMLKQSALMVVYVFLTKDEMTSEANKMLGEARAIADEMMSDVDKHFQKMSQIQDEVTKSMSSIDDIFKRAQDIVSSLGRSDPAREIEQFVVKYKDPLEFRWDGNQLFAGWLPPEEQKLSKNLVNRRGEEGYLLERLKHSNRLGLYGPIGSGKTTLLLHLWNNDEIATIFSDGGIWIQSARFLQEDIPSIIASALGETLVRSSPLIIQATEVFHLLNGKKMLIILDGATSRDDVDFVRKCVPQNCTLLVSSSSIRCLQALIGEIITLGPLELSEAVSLLHTWCAEPKLNKNFDTAVEQEICRELAGLPLAIELVGRYIRQSGDTLQQVYEYFRSLKASDISSGNRALHKALAICIAGISEDSIDFLKRLSGLGIKYFSKEIVQSVNYAPEKIQLSDLLELGLLRCDQSDEFYLVPWLSIVLNHRRHENILHGRSGLQVFDFLQTYFSTYPHDYDRLERVRLLLSWLLYRAPKNEFSSQIVELVRLATPFLMNAGHWSILLRALAAGLECSQLTSNLEADNLFSYHMALVHYHSGHEKLAVDFLEKKVNELRKREDWFLLLMALYIIGRVLEKNGKYEQASSFYQQALDLPTVELITQTHIAYHLAKVENFSNNPEAARRANQLALNAIKQFGLFSRMQDKRDS